MATTPTLEWTRLLGTNFSDHSRAVTTGLDGSIFIIGSTDGSLDGQTDSGDPHLFKLIVKTHENE